MEIQFAKKRLHIAFDYYKRLFSYEYPLKGNLKGKSEKNNKKNIYKKNKIKKIKNNLVCIVTSGAEKNKIIIKPPAVPDFSHCPNLLDVAHHH